MKASGSCDPPARMTAMVRGRGSGGAGCDAVVAARRCDSAVVSVRQMPGHLGGDTLELGPSEAQHQAVAHGGDGGGARPAGQEGDLADWLLGADLGERLAPALEGDGKTPGDDDVKRVGRIALAHQDVAAFEGARFELGHEGGALVGAELGEDPHGGKAGF